MAKDRREQTFRQTHRNGVFWSSTAVSIGSDVNGTKWWVAVIGTGALFRHVCLMALNDQTLCSRAARGKWRWPTRNNAAWLAALLLLGATYFGSSRNFGLFLLSLPVLGTLLVAALVASAFNTAGRACRQATLLLICLSPIAYFCSYGFAQHIRFMLWAPAHYRQLTEASDKDGIIMGWDSWGMAGQDTFSYLVVDTKDQLKLPARRAAWSKQVGQSCGLWEARKMWPKLYVVTTYTNCPFDGVDPAA
jgi:hypothetical protein